MGELIRAYDWSKTTIGHPSTWPQPLCIAVRIMLDSPFAMYIAWGTDYLQIYNDGYRPILGATKHPEALGNNANNTFAEIWPTIGPMFNGVMQGIPVGFPDFVLHLDRNGFPEECVFDFSYSPLRLENNQVGGVLVTVIETTQKVQALNRLKDSEQLLQFAIEATDLGIWDLNPATNTFTGNNRLKDWFGLKPEEDIALPLALAVIADDDKERVTAAIGEALQFSSGGLYDISYTIIHPATKAEKTVRAKGRATFNEEGIAIRFNGTLQDITKETIAQLQIEKSEQSLKRYKHMADNANDPFILMREDGTFAYLNELAIQRWGYTIEEARKLRVPDVDPIYNDDIFKDAFLKAQKQKLPQIETLHKRKDGTLYPVEINMGGLTLDGKNYMFAIARDITERKKLEKAAKESEQKIRSFILQAPVAMALYRGPQHEIEIVNEALLQIWDKKLEEVINRPLFEAMSKAKGQGFEEKINMVYTTGDKYEAFGIPIILTRNGRNKTIYVNIVYQPYREVGGEITGIVEVVSDVTEQVNATQQLAASEKQFRLFADSMQNLAWIANPDGWIYWYNKQWFDYTGTSLEEMQGWGWQKVHHPDHIDNIIKQITALWSTNKPFEFTFPLRRFDGVYRWFLTRAYPVTDENGKVERWIGTNTDITDQKNFNEELEKKVQERTEEIIMKTSELKDSNIKLEQKNIDLDKINQELQSFAYISSHDLQEPLRKIQTFASLIKNKEVDNLSEYGKNIFSRMESAAERMQALINDLLAYSRTSNDDNHFQHVKLNDVIEHVKNDLKEEIEQQNATIENENLCDINIIPFQFQQVFYNLISNALKFSQPGIAPHISIISRDAEIEDLKKERLNTEKKYCHITVKDNGIGFDDQYKDKIFELFQRLHGKTEYNGTGIGLAIVKKIIDNHNGMIRATGEKNNGAQFDIFIPTDL